MNTRDKKKQLLKKLEEGHPITSACNSATITRGQYYRWMEKDKKFKAKSVESLKRGSDARKDTAMVALLSKAALKDVNAAKTILRIEKDAQYTGVSERKIKEDKLKQFEELDI